MYNYNAADAGLSPPSGYAASSASDIAAADEHERGSSGGHSSADRKKSGALKGMFKRLKS